MFEHMTLSVVKFIQEVVLLVPAHPLLRAKTLKPHNFSNCIKNFTLSFHIKNNYKYQFPKKMERINIPYIR